MLSHHKNIVICSCQNHSHLSAPTAGLTTLYFSRRQWEAETASFLWPSIPFFFYLTTKLVKKVVDYELEEIIVREEI